MDSQTFEQIPFSEAQVGDAQEFLKENLEVDVLFWRGKPINIELPPFIEAKITQLRARHQGRHRVERHQARHDRDRRHRAGPALREGRRADPGRHAHRRVRRAGELKPARERDDAAPTPPPRAGLLRRRRARRLRGRRRALPRRGAAAAPRPPAPLRHPVRHLGRRDPRLLSRRHRAPGPGARPASSSSSGPR